MKKNTITIENKKANHDYFIEETIECGISLKGNEVKSIRQGKCQIKDAWCTVQSSNLVIRGMHVSRYETSNLFDIDETRERVLLAHRKEIDRLAGKIQREGITLIPLKIYFSHNKAKVLVGVCKGKHNYDKRQSLKDKQMKRDIDRELKERSR